VAIYGIFDSTGNCLYVGRSDRHPASRWREHADKPWFADATDFRVLDTLTEALAIEHYEPLHNAAPGSRALDPESAIAAIDSLSAQIDRLYTFIADLNALHVAHISAISAEIRGESAEEQWREAQSAAETLRNRG
jgi:hypothetical protein